MSNTPEQALEECLTKKPQTDPFYFSGNILYREIPMPYSKHGTTQIVVGHNMTATEVYAYFGVQLDEPAEPAELSESEMPATEGNTRKTRR